MTADRTEDAGLAGVLTLTIGGRPRYLPVLKLKHSRAWKERLGGVAAGIEMDDDLSVTVARAANLASDTALDLVAAYDRTDVLGGREAIEDEATDVELFAALEAMVKATFPFEGHVRSVVEAFGPQLRQVGMALMTSVAVRLSQASSTPTPSVTGDSTPTPLRSVSPTSSSSSSGPMTRRRASPKSATGGT
jgi:hypothetical protein